MVQDQDWPLWTLDGFTVLEQLFGFVFGIFGGMAILSRSQLSGFGAVKSLGLQFYQGSGQGSFIQLRRGPYKSHLRILRRAFWGCKQKGHRNPQA